MSSGLAKGDGYPAHCFCHLPQDLSVYLGMDSHDGSRSRGWYLVATSGNVGLRVSRCYCSVPLQRVCAFQRDNCGNILYFRASKLGSTCQPQHYHQAHGSFPLPVYYKLLRVRGLSDFPVKPSTRRSEWGTSNYRPSIFYQVLTSNPTFSASPRLQK